MNRTLKTGALAAAAALALPGAALADKPQDPGSKGKTKAAEKQAKAGKRCAKNPKVGFVARGTLVSLTRPTLVANLTKGNRHARSFFAARGSALPSEQTFTLADATKVTFGDGITDVSGDSKVDETDLQAGTTYRVKLIGKVLKAKRNCTVSDSAGPTIRKVVISLPEQEQTEQS